jgi:hypothetical protein
MRSCRPIPAWTAGAIAARASTSCFYERHVDRYLAIAGNPASSADERGREMESFEASVPVWLVVERRSVGPVQSKICQGSEVLELPLSGEAFASILLLLYTIPPLPAATWAAYSNVSGRRAMLTSSSQSSASVLVCRTHVTALSARIHFGNAPGKPPFVGFFASLRFVSFRFVSLRFGSDRFGSGSGSGSASSVYLPVRTVHRYVHSIGTVPHNHELLSRARKRKN